jgi:cyclophilin family peptidyl-prolyl cis-trans isomerase
VILCYTGERAAAASSQIPGHRFFHVLQPARAGSTAIAMFKTIVFALALGLSVAAHAAGPQVDLRTNMGTIVIELDPEKAPNTVANFLQYVKSGQYDGTVFHRVIPGFMIQGGGMTPDMREKPTRAPIRNEASNGLRNTVGTVAMARTGDPHSASAQFFINVADNGFLDFRSPTQQGYGYAVFGRVVKGMDVVNRIAGVPTGQKGPHSDVPLKPVVIEHAEVMGGTPSSK